MKNTMNFLISIVIFIAGIFIFTIMTNRDFYLHEAQLALLVQQMWHHGFSLFPQAYQGMLREVNLFTSVALSYLSCLLFGKFTVFTIALPFAVASALTLSVTYLIGALRSRIWGLSAVMFVVGTEIFLLSARTLEPTIYMTLITTLSLFAVIVLEVNAFFLYMGLFVLFILGYLVNGILGLFFAAIITWIYLLWRGQIKKCIGVFICAIIALLACFGVMVWLTSLVGGSELVHQMISGQLAILTHEQFTRHLFSSWNFVWFYCASLPVAILVIGVRWNNIIFSWDKWTLQFLRALFTWVIVIMLLTLANGVDITAMLPITPMMALIAGYLFTDEHTGTISDMMRQLVVWILSCIPFVAFILVIIAAVINYFDPGKYDTPFYLASLLLLFLTSLVSFFAIFKKSLEINAKTVLAMILALLSYIVVNLGVVEPMREVKNQTIDLAQQLLILMEKAPENLIFYKIGPQAEERLLVLDLGIQADAAGVSKKLSMIETPIFITKPQEMLTYQTPAYFVTTETEYNTFNGEIKSDTQKLLSGEIQGEKVVVFKVNTPMVEKLETPSLLHASAAQHSD